MLVLSRRAGTIRRWYNGERGYGFIQPDDGGEAVFVHHTGIAAHTTTTGPGSLTEGARVTYEVIREKMAGLWAKNVCAIDEATQGERRPSPIVAVTRG
jgi:CspA family cold shock protein